ncbi:MAG: plasmid mobilization relaxosome protein MobC [Alteromonadaceae bacterium]|nr:plasmid mobilization relaxosome protein MobC [Alteromonadaceae bacterium]
MANKSEIISFRLTQDEYGPYRRIIEESGTSRAEFFRKVFLELSPTVTITAKKHAKKESPKVLFYANKTSNNINQIARQLNLAAKTGELDRRMLNRAVIALESIEREFRKKTRGE